MSLRAAYLAVNTSAAGKVSEARDKHKHRREKKGEIGGEEGVGEIGGKLTSLDRIITNVIERGDKNI